MSQYLQSQKELSGFGFGFLGVLIFSLTLPATRLAVSELDPVFVGLGRSVIAAFFSLILLIITRQKIPPWRFFPRFGVVVVGVIIGFPLLSALAMRDASAAYGAVIIGLLPLATAFCGVWRGGEKLAWSFWIFALLGSGLVISFALLSGTGAISFADLALLGAAAAAGLGYAEGAILARTFGAWQVICWSLIFSMPVLLPIVIQHTPAAFFTISVSAWLAFLYLSIFSMFLGFLAWYQGLFLGGIARVGQVQLIQPFLTILASSVFLGEALTLTTLGFAAGVVICVALGKRA